jgi:hypothetical protein
MKKDTGFTIGLFPICLILLLLKVLGVGISWLWVFSPFWLPIAIIFSIGAIFFSFLICATIIILPFAIIYQLL